MNNTLLMKLWLFLNTDYSAQSRTFDARSLTHGATHVGGVDPALVDRHVDHSIAKIFELATTFNKN